MASTSPTPLFTPRPFTSRPVEPRRDRPCFQEAAAVPGRQGTGASEDLLPGFRAQVPCRHRCPGLGPPHRSQGPVAYAWFSRERRTPRSIWESSCVWQSRCVWESARVRVQQVRQRDGCGASAGRLGDSGFACANGGRIRHDPRWFRCRCDRRQCPCLPREGRTQSSPPGSRGRGPSP